MHLKVILFAVIAIAFATAEDVVPIVAQEMDVEPEGKFHWTYESGDGSKASQQGEVRTVGEETAGVLQGSFSYQGDDGKTYSISYIADENGYQPVGEHLPVPPAVPVMIQKALDYLATAKPPQER